MFLPNLQKNIQELERQISRLETECEHMGKRETSPGGHPKQAVKESTNQPFITGPSISTTTYSSKMLKLATGNAGGSVSLRPTPKSQDVENVRFNQTPKQHEKKGKTSCEDTRKESRCCGRKLHEKGSHNSMVDQKRYERNPCRKFVQSIREVSESSDDSQLLHLDSLCKIRNKLKESANEQLWCELFQEKPSNSKCLHRAKFKEFNDQVLTIRRDQKNSSDEESCDGPSATGGGPSNGQGPTDADEQATSRSKRRSRSARTKKNFTDEFLPEVQEVSNKSLQEKETQCLLWNDEKGRGEFFVSVNESMKVLQGLIEELKNKTSQERKNDVLNDMQNTLKKITETKYQQEPPPTSEENGLSIPEGAENITSMKKALCAVKKICEELAEEKSALAEEVAMKNVTLSNFKAKEKEYLALIASLKHGSEKLKEAAEEGTRAKRELKILTVKLQEEAKVIEALKKSHEKMQEIVENYVLENDKLKAHVRITKLESQKYNVLLAGKEAEIVKYKREIESFQKQITEQLTLLRSRATETEVQHTVEAINNQASTLQKDDRQNCDETLESSSTKTQSTREVQDAATFDVVCKPDWDHESKPSISSNGTQKRVLEDGTRISEPENPPSNSGNLRNSINELLQEIKRESSDVYWLSAPNSCGASVRSTSNLSSEDASDASLKD